jgi:hypothetical protein
MKLDSNNVAQELNEWFQSVLRLVEDSLFNIAPEGPHRDAVVLDSLRRNARIVQEARLEPVAGELNVVSNGKMGNLYSPLCFFLAAGCRQLRTSLGVGHWRAALDNVHHLQQQIAKARSYSADIGLDIGTPATVFKAEFDEAIRQAGLINISTILNKENRQIALALAINWGMRLLLAYAAEAPLPSQPSGRKDLAWLTALISPPPMN